MKYFIQLQIIFLFFAGSFTASAGYMCTEDLSTVYLNSMQQVNEPFGAIDLTLVSGTGYDSDLGRESTECAGFFDGNDQKTPKLHNIGEWGDGFFNGEIQQAKVSPNNTDVLLNPKNTLFDPLYDPLNPNDPFAFDGTEGYNPDLVFIDPDGVQDIGGVGGIESDGQNDPGWVFLGKTNDAGDDFDYAHTGIGLFDENEESLEWDIEDLITIDFGCSANHDLITEVDINSECNEYQWSISPIGTISEDLEDLFGKGFFDHLAFVFKAGSEFVVYDFDFTIIEMELEAFYEGLDVDLTVPYNLSGTFNWEGQHGISHISLYAHDPVLVDNEIPEPKSALLMLFALALLLLRFKSKYDFN